MGMQEQPAKFIEKRCVATMGNDARAEMYIIWGH